MDMEDDDESSNSSQPSGASSQPQVVQRVSMVTAPSTVPAPATLMLVTSNAAVPGTQPTVAVRQAAAVVGQPGTPAAITVKPTTNGIGAAGGLVVLSGASMAGAAPPHSVGISTQVGLSTALAVRTAAAVNSNPSKTHTILVMPVSSSGVSDVSAIKRVKTE